MTDADIVTLYWARDEQAIAPVSYTHLYSLRLTFMSTPYSEVTGSTCRVP